MKLEAIDLVKSYQESDKEVAVLKGAHFVLEDKACASLIGSSGSGKSTLLHCLALLDRVQSGRILYDCQDVSKLNEEEAAQFRLKNLGFVFQFHHLIPELTAEENVRLPASLLGHSHKVEAAELLAWVGLGDKRHRFPWQLSGGEQQRVAVARALVNRPKVLFTDEATGNLDRDRSLEILELLLRTQKEFGTTLLSVTHDSELAGRYEKKYRLKDGQIWDCVGQD